VTPGVRRLATGAVTATAVFRAVTASPPGGPARWTGTNYRGRSVSLATGPALAVAAATTSSTPVAAAVAGWAAAAVGAHDDAVGGRHDVKGLAGHLGALRGGQVTTGTVKVLGISVAGLVAARLLARSGSDAVSTGAIVAGSANLANLLDLRPGRALKAGLGAALLLGEPGIAGACLAVLPGDLRERTMLGDAGANALGAVLGVALAARARSRTAQVLALGAIVGLTAASERVSFSAVIDSTPALRWLDRLGRGA
jgi:UDP-N-acetylmuramyl pentapeptide phosphotransferase/UDP-N-acetylglucosamine-1-phosphate transferase